ncbi:MAG: hypothetical protein ACK4K7_03570 [Allosphingosinicella sp.]|uniref:hypothetical protein n=1 Tax=Allosphingosinicella sp. TaxID=2823234 RepID=UPI003934B222
MLGHAAGQGHPKAKQLFARWMVLGKLGLRRIPAGVGLAVREAMRFASQANGF